MLFSVAVVADTAKYYDQRINVTVRGVGLARSSMNENETSYIFKIYDV